MIIVTAIAASVLGLLYVKLSLNVIGYRRKHGVSVGDGGNEDLLRVIRAHANLAEYAPIALILIASLEINHTPWWVTTVLATAFVLGRLLHPSGMKEAGSALKPRVRGMQLTLLSMIGLAVANLVIAGLHLYAA
ncbi:MAG: MAPEG family protein [Candidatus Scalindua sp.]